MALWIAGKVLKVKHGGDRKLQKMTANIGAGWKPLSVTATMNPELLAWQIGTTTSNVNFFLERFRELGFIDSKGAKTLVNGSLVNIVLHDDGMC